MRVCGKFALTGMLAVLAVAAAAAPDDELVRHVTPEEVAAAKASTPVEDATAVRNRLGAGLMATWVSEGRVPGRELFHDDFADGTFEKNWIDDYAQKGMIKVRPDGRGGQCLWIPPRSNDFNCVGFKLDRLVPVDPTHPTALLWETRQPAGNTPFVLVRFFDENRRDIRGEYQFRANVDPTQPTIFQRNAHLVTTKMPAKTRYLRVIFHHCPIQSDEFPGEIANVRVVDLSGPVNEMLKAEEPVRDERAKAGARDVLVYCDDNLTASYPVLPKSAAVPGRTGGALKVRECPGEKTRTTAILWSKSGYENVTVEVSDLTCGVSGHGGTIPGSSVELKVVKAHYQGEGAPTSFVAIGPDQVIMPELFLNDDSLVIPDHANRRNLVRFQRDGQSWYVDINTLPRFKWGVHVPAERLPIADAKTFRPFEILPGQNKQLMLRFAVPANAKPGLYTGFVAFRSDGSEIARLPVELTVLPFTLPKAAETVYDPSREFTMGLYVWARLSADGRAYYSPMNRSKEQMMNEWRMLVDYGVTDPAFIWPNDILFDDAKFRRYLKCAREAGFPGKVLHLGSSGNVGNATDPEKLRAKQAELTRAMAVAREFGFEDVYFYGLDEAKGKQLLSQIPAWKAAREVGAKVMVSGYSQHFKLVGDYLDLIVYADDAGSANPADWHSKGARIWKYNTPQTGPEDPGLFRRNYGVGIWKRGFDGANTYCDMGAASVWNDVCAIRDVIGRKTGGSVYRGMCIVYPTTDGVIGTTALSGLESAIKDCRILTKFRQLLREKPNADAQAWFDAIDGDADDLVKVRREAIDWILRLR